MKKTILIVSIIIVCGLAIFGIVKLTSNSDNSSVADNAAATITVDDQTTASNSESDTKDTNDASTSSTDAASNEVVKGDVEITIGSATASAEETVIIPVKVETVPEAGIGSCNFNIKYDTNVLEVVEVLPGDITENIDSSLEYSVIETTGMVSYLYTSSSNGKDTITKPGIISNIKFKIKKDAQKGTTTITNGTAGAFGDNSLNKITATFTRGEINVQ
ncbi:cohesin [Ruminiclostridium herbifermentans]|uniref:Cohesin n=1 Tax=Ruminiclostridium herbifermentans TaxID=2488810 RepID=A0A4U7J6V8_9FIRM|nr:cohesin domain-containing protein [Ruminiclostridium herbifermentans]QNU67292.1 cohesin [Ruminiclostridium herbifermentans]